MSLRSQLLALVLLALASLATSPAVRAADSLDGCTGFITSLPATIASQGIWCLKGDLTTSISSGSAITINTNKVTIDCNHYRLDGSAAGSATTTIGIYANARARVAVRHCTIGGFYIGAKLTGNGHVVDGNDFIGNMQTGLYIEGDVAKSDSLVTDNRILNTGGSTGGSFSAFGIYAHFAVDMTDNTVSGVSARNGSNGNAYGIYTVGTTHGATLRRNEVQNINRDIGLAYGIYNDNSTHVIVVANDVSSVGDVGIFCSNNTSAARDNVVHDFTTAISNCADAGGNFHTP